MIPGKRRDLQALVRREGVAWVLSLIGKGIT
jgi:hypothetical protein